MEKKFTFGTNDIVVNYSSEFGHNNVKYPFAYDEENIYFNLHQKNFPMQEYENSTVKNEHEYLYEKDDEIKGDNITDENHGIVEYGNYFIICKINHSKQQ